MQKYLVHFSGANNAAHTYYLPIPDAGKLVAAWVANAVDLSLRKKDPSTIIVDAKDRILEAGKTTPLEFEDTASTPATFYVYLDSDGKTFTFNYPTSSENAAKSTAVSTDNLPADMPTGEALKAMFRTSDQSVELLTIGSGASGAAAVLTVDISGTRGGSIVASKVNASASDDELAEIFDMDNPIKIVVPQDALGPESAVAVAHDIGIVILVDEYGINGLRP